jgi:Fe2+ or Zn2+ uptake regulation protein
MPEFRVDVLCRECGRRRTCQAHVGPGSCAAPGDTRGFVIDHVEITLLGDCPACLARTLRGNVPTAG